MEIEILIKRLKTGDQEVWKMMIDMYSRKVYNIALNFTGSKEEAADITQDIFLKVYRNIDKFNEELSFTAWLIRLSKNYCIDHWRKHKYHRKHMELDENGPYVSEDIDTPEERFTNEYDATYIRNKMQLLPPDLMPLMIMRDVEDMSYQEISEYLELPLGTVKSRINRARAKLAKILLMEGR
ncbi:MAG: RNA polymerase sigma factor [Candidatus Omnitrophota bacterium]